MLADAHFTLYGANEDGTIDKTNVIKVTKDTDANGKYTYAEDQNATDAITDVITVGSGIDEKDYNLHINGLKAGVYYLEETQAPDGYNKLAAPVKVTIKKQVIQIILFQLQINRVWIQKKKIKSSTLKTVLVPFFRQLVAEEQSHLVLLQQSLYLE